MTEAEWLACEDPGAMLEHVGRGCDPTGLPAPAVRVSARKLRLFACAIARLAVPSPGRVVREDVVTAERYAHGLATASELAQARIASDLWCCDTSATVAAEASARILRPGPGAALLRDLVGNPWRPVTLPTTGLRCPDCLDHPGLDGRLTDAGRCRSCGGSARVKRCPWLTSTVLALARAAYSERREAPCYGCNPGPADAPARYISTQGCTVCGNRGFITDGLLEPDRLAVLADALEDAGCDSEELLMHLRGWERCRYCLLGSHGSEQACGGRGYRKWPDGKLAGVMRLRGPHARGCWALDLILGKE